MHFLLERWEIPNICCCHTDRLVDGWIFFLRILQNNLPFSGLNVCVCIPCLFLCVCVFLLGYRNIIFLFTFFLLLLRLLRFFLSITINCLGVGLLLLLEFTFLFILPEHPKNQKKKDFLFCSRCCYYYFSCWCCIWNDAQRMKR